MARGRRTQALLSQGLAGKQVGDKYPPQSSLFLNSDLLSKVRGQGSPIDAMCDGQLPGEESRVREQIENEANRAFGKYKLLL